MRGLSLTIALLLAVTGCKQVFGLENPVAFDGGGPIPTIGFGMPTTLADEASGLVAVPVLLTDPAASDVSVAFRILGGTATEGEDYTIEQGNIVITPGSQAAALEIAIAADQVLEDNETIEIALEMPRGATLGLAQHTLTINATVLPRVNFLAADSSISEANTRQSMLVSLDVASPIEINVMIGGSGTATSVSDYDIVDSSITFAPGSTTQLVQVDVKHDTLDEDDETAILTLLNADAAIVGTMPTHTLTISDNDNPPTVSLTPSNETVSESAPTASFTVQLNTPSGKDVTVPFTAGGTAVVTADYTYATTTPVLIAAGMTSATVTINLVNDTTDEPTKTLTTSLGTPTNGVLGSPSVHTLTITDDEVVCVGPSGTTFAVCYDNAPTVASTLPATLNTDTAPQCQTTQPGGWTAGGQAPACVVWATNISASTTVVTGSRPLVLAATGTITITSGLDASSRRNPARVGPGAPSASCAAFPTAPNGSTSGAGGGAGGSFMTKGGNGGAGVVSGGTSPAADAAEPTVLRAGCSGQRGGIGDGISGGVAGVGGGAVYLVAGTSIIASGASINASGAGGDVVTFDDTGGSGGGTGGMIRLYAPTISVTGANIVANGGGGSEGNSELAMGNPGADVDPSTPLQPALGGNNGGTGGNGGNGFAGITAATNGLTGPDGGGGGGGGGGGLVRSNVALTGATVSAGLTVIQ